MMTSFRERRSYWASIFHRVSGLLLVLFLPFHFLVLGLSIEGAERLDRFLRLADMPLVKLAEAGLVVLLTVHMVLGLRLLVLELLPWPNLTEIKTQWINLGIGASLVTGLIFLIGAL
ncbi:MAG: succinate dehydrogenase, cytochrome b556 subunit [Ectothiorhodospiraceae bacterium]|nr:succinate dehydrogenase, cytochrome b556 subunit [Ectothiorhodospiraceae bacterium]